MATDEGEEIVDDLQEAYEAFQAFKAFKAQQGASIPSLPTPEPEASSIMDRLLTRPSGEKIGLDQAIIGPIAKTAKGFPFLDEAISGVNALFDVATDDYTLGEIGQAYSDRKAQLDAYAGDFSKASPAVGVGLDVATGLKLPINSKIGTKATALGKGAQAAKEGAAIGALFGVAEGDGLADRLGNAATGGALGGGLGGAIGTTAGAISNRIGRTKEAIPETARKLEQAGFGVNKTLLRKAGKKLPSLVEEDGTLKTPLANAVKSFRETGGDAVDPTDAGKLIKELNRQMGELQEEIGGRIVEATQKQTDVIVPQFSWVDDYVSKQPGVTKDAAKALADDLVTQTINNTDGTLVSLQQEKIALGRKIAKAKWGQDESAALKTDIMKRLYGDLRRTIEDSYEQITGKSGKEIAKLNDEIGAREGLMGAFFEKMLGAEQDAASAALDAVRTTRGAGQSIIAAGAQGMNALLAPLAYVGRKLNDPNIKIKAADFLRSEGLDTALSLADRLFSPLANNAGQVGASIGRAGKEANEVRDEELRGLFDSVAGSDRFRSLSPSSPVEYRLGVEATRELPQEELLLQLDGRSAADSAIQQQERAAQRLLTSTSLNNTPSPSLTQYGESMTPTSPKKLTISTNGIDLIKQFEGLRLNPYDDGVGVMTIGYGHTGSGVKKGKITEEEAEELLQKDIEKHQRAVQEAVKVPLTQEQFDALVSFAFNAGPTGFKRSTLVKKLNAGDLEGAAKEFSRWVYGTKGGKKVRLKGLEKRRAQEASLFERGIIEA